MNILGAIDQLRHACAERNLTLQSITVASDQSAHVAESVIASYIARSGPMLPSYTDPPAWAGSTIYCGVRIVGAFRKKPEAE